MADTAEQYLNDLAVTIPSMSQTIQEISDYKNRKLWHQFTDAVSFFIRNEQVKSIVDLVEFYKILISENASKLNPLSFSYIAVEISKQIKDVETRLAFLTDISTQKFINEEIQSRTLLQSVIAELKISFGNVEDGSKDLETIESNLEVLHSSDSSVYASFYKAKSLMHKAKTQINEFYKSGLQYLSYAQMENVDKDERAALAFDLGIAALVGEDIFNFGELLDKQILDALKGTPNEWLAYVIDSFNSGNIAAWEALQSQYASIMNTQTDLLNNQQLLRQKIAILSVVEHIFNKSSRDSNIPFETISEVSGINISEIELLLMKALAHGLIKGRIDQSKGVITVDWVQPRILSAEQVEKMKGKIHLWKDNVKSALDLVEGHLTPELIS